MRFCTLSVKEGASLKLRKKKKQLGFHLNKQSQLNFLLSGHVYENKLAFFFFFFMKLSQLLATEPHF